jgi:hypothetical protein
MSPNGRSIPRIGLPCRRGPGVTRIESLRSCMNNWSTSNVKFSHRLVAVARKSGQTSPASPTCARTAGRRALAGVVAWRIREEPPCCFVDYSFGINSGVKLRTVNRASQQVSLTRKGKDLTYLVAQIREVGRGRRGARFVNRRPLEPDHDKKTALRSVTLKRCAVACVSVICHLVAGPRQAKSHI